MFYKNKIIENLFFILHIFMTKKIDRHIFFAMKEADLPTVFSMNETALDIWRCEEMN